MWGTDRLQAEQMLNYRLNENKSNEVTDKTDFQVNTETIKVWKEVLWRKMQSFELKCFAD